MLSRLTAHLISKAYCERFQRSIAYGSGHNYSYTSVADTDGLYDFLFVENYAAWFCNLIEKIHNLRPLSEFFMRIHTGESLVPSTKDWVWKAREMLGQQYLEDLACSILKDATKDEIRRYVTEIDELKKQIRVSLELDGFQWKDGKLLKPEKDVLDTEEESGVLATLYHDLQLRDEATSLHHLKLSEEHYLAGRWDDCISNSRKFLECSLSAIAADHGEKVKGTALPPRTLEKPVEVRDYLERETLIEAKEKEALAKVYGLLSHTGGHPYMASNDQARLLRHLALTLTQFALLRYRGSLNAAGVK